MTTSLTFDELSEHVKSIGVLSDSAATLLWDEGITSEALLKLLTKEDMQSIGVNLGSRVAIYEHYHSSGAKVESLLSLAGLPIVSIRGAG